VAPSIVVGLNAVIVAVTDEEPRLLTVERAERARAGARAHEPALPFGPLDPAGHRTLELGLRAWVREQTGLDTLPLPHPARERRRDRLLDEGRPPRESRT
jgi:hypothetical protein